MQGLVRQQVHSMRNAFRRGWRLVRQEGPSQIQFWFIALGLGVASGLAAIAFRAAVEWLQATIYGTENVNLLASFAETLPWIWVLLIPAFGGIAVGIILHWATPDGRVRSVADVIEGAALNDGRVEKKAGIASALCSWITLSTGGSTGREGPVVHIASMFSSWIANVLRVDGVTGRDLLGCAVAAAVSASFNAPIAGALFALEVVLRHFALHAFAPIVVASAAGTVINRLVYGDVTEFVLPGTTTVEFYLELPAFFLLGLVCGLIAVIMMRTIFFADDLETALQRRLGLPHWMRPAVAGLLLGVIAIYFPHVIGVGYETTSLALTGNLGLGAAFIFAVVKVAAVSITMAGRMGGGIFSPSLMVGALTGLVFGHIATGFFPDASSAFTLYALAGMGAVAAAVLGAPISTTLIVFELTGDWQTGLAVMISVSMSTALASRVVDRSFFLTQLERRNVHLAEGPQAYLLAMFRVSGVMRKLGDEGAADPDACQRMIEQGLFLQGQATLEVALPMFDRSGVAFLPVVALEGEESTPVLQGALFQVDALKRYNQALAATAREEHS
ncbi:chloride channel protein, CIC family [Tropicibacter naphthalenivorans]|uniref:H(+)/Cl(-) exchange transporter ClcA n=2 Tax=Tropicibacter naphthalenivorans TaxID=441103 RepID=A0A0P1GL53_9RHOB|nr:H(+)/Cl(-) exchange transporter ClcA [Tropicibacter naphthalenivorans]SMC39932.1 chloride channel protein, CIC family [Tropicibacter naphthalenivorans]